MTMLIELSRTLKIDEHQVKVIGHHFPTQIAHLRGKVPATIPAELRTRGADALPQTYQAKGYSPAFGIDF